MSFRSSSEKKVFIFITWICVILTIKHTWSKFSFDVWSTRTILCMAWLLTSYLGDTDHWVERHYNIDFSPLLISVLISQTYEVQLWRWLVNIRFTKKFTWSAMPCRILSLTPLEFSVKKPSGEFQSRHKIYISTTLYHQWNFYQFSW